MEKIMLKLYEKDNEIWTHINCYNVLPNTYEISTCGNVKRVKDGYPIKQQILKNQFGVYNAIHLQTIDSGRLTKGFLVHRLVAKTFIINPYPECIQVNHKDNNGLNNSVFNLEWVTPSYNTRYTYKTNSMNNSGLNNLGIYNIHNMISNGFTDEQILINVNMSIDYTNIDFINRIRISYNNNMPDSISNKPHNTSVYPIGDIHIMCGLIEQGMDYTQIAEHMGILLDDSKSRKHFRVYIRQIRNKITFTDISKDYNF